MKCKLGQFKNLNILSLTLQYTHVLKMIQQAGTLDKPEDGYRKVDESTKGEFAFIHDAAEIRYMYYQVKYVVIKTSNKKQKDNIKIINLNYKGKLLKIW